MTQQSRIDTLERQLQRALLNVSQGEEKLRSQQELISKLEQEKASLLRAKISSTEDEKKKGKLEERNHLQQRELNALQQQVLQEQKRAQVAEAERDAIHRDAMASIQVWKAAESDWDQNLAKLTAERDSLKKELSGASAIVHSEQERAHKIQVELEAINDQLVAKNGRIQDLLHDCAAKDDMIHKLRTSDETQRKLIAQKEEKINAQDAVEKAMNGKIEELQELITKLNLQIEGVKSSEAQLHHVIVDKEGTFQTLQQKILFLDEENKSLATENKVLKTAVAHADEQYSRARAFSESLQSQLNAAQKETLALRSEVTILQSKSDRTTAAVKVENESISKELNKAREEIIKKHGEIAALEFSLQKSEDEKSGLERALASASSTTEEAKREVQRLQYLQNQDIASTDERFKKQQHFIDELTSELAQSCKTYTERLNQADAEIQRLTVELTATRDAKKVAEQSFADAAAARDAISAQADQLRAVKNSLEVQLAESQLHTQHVEISCEELSRHLKSAETHSSAVEQGLAERTKEFVALQESFAQKTAQCDRLQDELNSQASEMTSQNATLDSRVAAAQATIARLESELKDQLNVHASITKCNGELTTELAAATAKLAHSSAEASQLSDSVLALRSDLDRANSSLSSVTSERDAFSRQAQEIGERIAELEANAVASQSEQLRVVTESHLLEMNQLKERIAASTDQIAALESSLRALNDANRRLTGEFDAAESRNEASRAKHGSLMAQITFLEKQRLADAEEAEAKCRRLVFEADLQSQKMHKLSEELRDAMKRKEEYKEALLVSKEKIVQQKSLRDQETASARQEISRLSSEVTYWHDRAQCAERGGQPPQKENMHPREGGERLSKKLRSETS